VLDRLDLIEPVLAVADTPAAVLMWDAVDGKELLRIPTGVSLRARFKYPYINVLLDGCRRSNAIELVADARVIGFDDRGDSVVVWTADGRTFSGPALVAADGVRSFFRQEIIGDGEPHPSGYAALRTIIPIDQLKVDVPRDSVLLWGGPGYHTIHYPLRRGSEFNIVAVYRTATHAAKADIAAHRAELEQLYRGAHPTMRALNSMIDFRWRGSVTYRNPARR
jgi:3-hydroxybenzoate 6-monooxygenase